MSRPNQKFHRNWIAFVCGQRSKLQPWLITHSYYYMSWSCPSATYWLILSYSIYVKNRAFKCSPPSSIKMSWNSSCCYVMCCFSAPRTRIVLNQLLPDICRERNMLIGLKIAISHTRNACRIHIADVVFKFGPGAIHRSLIHSADTFWSGSIILRV